MSGGVENAAGDRRGPFPSSWGIPPGEVGSEERANWVAANVRRLVVNRKMSPEDRTAYVNRKRLGP